MKILEFLSYYTHNLSQYIDLKLWKKYQIDTLSLKLNNPNITQVELYNTKSRLDDITKNLSVPDHVKKQCINLIDNIDKKLRNDFNNTPKEAIPEILYNAIEKAESKIKERNEHKQILLQSLLSDVLKDFKIRGFNANYAYTYEVESKYSCYLGGGDIEKYLKENSDVFKLCDVSYDSQFKEIHINYKKQ